MPFTSALELGSQAPQSWLSTILQEVAAAEQRRDAETIVCHPLYLQVAPLGRNPGDTGLPAHLDVGSVCLGKLIGNAWIFSYSVGQAFEFGIISFLICYGPALSHPSEAWTANSAPWCRAGVGAMRWQPCPGNLCMRSCCREMCALLRQVLLPGWQYPAPWYPPHTL